MRQFEAPLAEEGLWLKREDFFDMGLVKGWRDGPVWYFLDIYKD